MEIEARNPSFAEEVRKSFAAQSIMQLIGAELTRVEPGVVEISLPYRKELTQQDGFLHAGIITTIADSAAGYAAFSLMPAGSRRVKRGVQSKSPATGEGRTFSRAGGSNQAGKDSDCCARRCVWIGRRGTNSRGNIAWHDVPNLGFEFRVSSSEFRKIHRQAAKSTPRAPRIKNLKLCDRTRIPNRGRKIEAAYQVSLLGALGVLLAAWR